jgi:cell division protein FtsW
MMTRLFERARSLAFPEATADGAPLFWMITAVVGVLTAVGLVMVLSASSVMSIDNYKSPWYVFERQLFFAILGILAFFIAARVDYHRWARWANVLFVCTVGALVVVLVPGIGRMAGGARRWIGPNTTIGVQPSEIAKLVMLIYAAQLLARRASRTTDWRQSLVPMCAVTIIMCGLVVIEPDFATAMEIAFVGAGVLIAAGLPWRQLSIVAVPALVVGSALAVAEPYRLSRVLTFLHPGRDPQNRSYQITQSLIALGNGGWTGVGLGQGHAKWMFLPAAHTDFIFAIIGEETGVIGCALVLGLFAAFAVAGAKVALRSSDRFGMLVASGVTIWISGQALLNVAMVVGFAPVQGTPLPFISAGGSSLVILMAAAGILANVARQCQLATPVVSARPEAARTVRRERVSSG